MKSRWEALEPPWRLVFAGFFAGLVGFCLLLDGGDLPLTLLAAFIIWDASCLMVSEAPNYASWSPTGRIPRFAKWYTDIVHSIRYGRGQTLLRISVLSLVAALTVAAAVWTVTS